MPMANSKSNVSEKNYFDIPVWRRYTLTIEEALATITSVKESCGC